MKFDEMDPRSQNQIAPKIAMGAIRTGSLPGLTKAIGMKNDLDQSMVIEWAVVQKTELDWVEIEKTHGRGAMLNLSHPLIKSMSRQSRRFRLPACSVENAKRYSTAISLPHGPGSDHRERPG